MQRASMAIAGACMQRAAIMRKVCRLPVNACTGAEGSYGYCRCMHAGAGPLLLYGPYGF